MVKMKAKIWFCKKVQSQLGVVIGKAILGNADKIKNVRMEKSVSAMPEHRIFFYLRTSKDFSHDQIRSRVGI